MKLSAYFLNKLLKSRIYGAFCARVLIPCYRVGVQLLELTFGRISRRAGRRDLCIIEENYLRNKKLDDDPRTSTANKLVSDQCGATGRRFRYGRFGADYNACEVIALHNARILMGGGSSLSEAFKTVQLRGGMFCGGKWGTKLSRIGKIARSSFGLKAQAVRRIEKIDRDGVYILSFWNCERDVLQGLHTVALRRENGTCLVYNLSVCRAVALTPDELLKRYKGGFIIAYIIS